MVMPQQIILRNLQRPNEVDVADDIEWLGNSFGFSAGRDTEKVTSRILKNVLQEVSSEGSTSTENIAEDLDLSIQRVNYHLRTLIDAGFLFREKRLIFVRQGSVTVSYTHLTLPTKRIV